MSFISLSNITKTYNSWSPNEIEVLKWLNLDITEGDFTAIMGPSGSGKSTLMNIVGMLDTPTSGSYLLNNTSVAELSETEQSLIRRDNIWFVFQGYNLLKKMKAWQQVALPLSYMGVPKTEKYERAIKALEVVWLADKINNRPNQLSGWQQQRVSIARALVTNPSLILADEPTGALDSKTGQEVMELFQTINQEENRTILLITHDTTIADYAKAIITISDGLFIDTTTNES